MEKNKVTALLLTVLVVAAEANNIVGKAQNGRSIWDEGLTANVNDYVDNTLALLIPFMQENGLDPLPLPEIHEYVEAKPVLITYSARVRLYDGYGTGLINLSRSGDQFVQYFSKMLRVRLQLQFTNLRFNYRYRAQVMNIGPGGWLIATLNRFAAIADVIIDFNNDEIQLQQFALTDVGRLSVSLTGSLVSWLLHPIVAMFVRIFDNTIIKVVESTIVDVAQKAIAGINKDIRELVQRLESADFQSIILNTYVANLKTAKFLNV